MNKEAKERIVQYIKLKDPKGDLVSEIKPNADYTKGKITYNKDNVILHRNISQLKDEEYVRAYLVVKLAKELKYPSNCIELEKEYEAGRPKTIKPRIDILVKDKRKKKERTFLFIEVKPPEKYESDKDYIEGQLFKLSAIEDREIPVQYLVYYTAEPEDTTIEDRAIIIDYTAQPTFPAWTEAGRISLDRLPKEYGIARKLIYVNKKDEDLKDEEKNLDRKVTAVRFNFLRKELHNVLWGGGGMNYNDVFSNLIKLFLAKIFDEDTTPVGKPYTFQIEFKDGKPESPEGVYKKINKLFKQSQKEYLGYTDAVIKNSVGIDREKISENKVAYVVEQMQNISLLENENKNNGDLLGVFFEGIVSEGFKQDKGQFFTHTNIVRFILYVLDMDNLAIDLINGKENPVKPRLPFICDPACGSGTFLIEAMKLITKAIKTSGKVQSSRKIEEFLAANFPGLRENIWAKEYIYGMEINPDLALATKVNMVLHGDGNINIFSSDGLLPFAKYEIPNKISALMKGETKTNCAYSYEVNEAFDVVISNPPFSVNLDTETKRTLPNRFMYHNKRNSENLFVERWYQILKEGGRLGVVLPESVFDTTENKHIRLFIYKYFKVKAVVSLPQVTFEPYTSTKTSLLFAQKKSTDEIELWNELWGKYSNEWGLLKTRCEKEVDHFINGKNISKKWAISKESEDKRKENVLRVLKDYLEKDDTGLSLKELVEKYQSEIVELCKFDKDTKDSFGFVNTWWVFGEVAKELNYQIFMAEVDHVGYKRSKRGEKPMPNDFYRLNADGEIAVDNGIKETALDFLRDVTWD